MTQEQCDKWVSDQRAAHRSWNQEVDQKPQPSSDASPPDRPDNRPYGPDPRGAQFLEEQRAEMSRWLDRQYEVARQTGDYVRDTMDEGATLTAMYFGALFGPPLATAASSLGLTAYIHGSILTEGVVTRIAAMRGGPYVLAFLNALGEASAVAGGQPPGVGLPRRPATRPSARPTPVGTVGGRTSDAKTPLPSIQGGMGDVLNIGSGNKPIKGATNLDVVPGRGVDVVADARATPFRPESFDRLIAEGLPSPLGADAALAGESFRVLRPGGSLRFRSRSKFGPAAVAAFQKAGFTDVKLSGGDFILSATKPRS